MQTRDHAMLGVTQSLCPECLALVPAKIISRAGRVYFRKQCPTHGVREDFVCSDAGAYGRGDYRLPGKLPVRFGMAAERGCPYDCGLCTEHEQHTCIGLVEITSSCNLKCRMCYAGSGPGGKHLSTEECRRAIDRLVETEGRPEVLQLSGGEPTIHPEFLEVLGYACGQPIDVVMINSNGLRFARERDLCKAVADFGPGAEIYLQFDGFRESTSWSLRGDSLVDVKLRAIDALGEAGVRVTLVTTLQAGVNEDEIGAVVQFGLERPWITGISFQPATYSGRHDLPADLERRITFPDVIRAIVNQCDGLFTEEDFMPLPCAHPNCHSVSYVYRSGSEAVPLMRLVNAHEHPDLLANGIMFSKGRAREVVERYLSRVGCCGGDCGTVSQGSSRNGKGDPLMPGHAHAGMSGVGGEFYSRALAEELTTADVFRITITSFLDAYNFDVQRLMRCCIHHVLPSGHIIPFCAYNVLYREGHVPLPPLAAVEPASVP